MMKRLLPIMGMLIVAMAAAACTSGSDEPDAALVIPTAASVATVPGQPEATPDSPRPAAPTLPASSASDPAAAAPMPTATIPYNRVAFVASDDTLNVRSGPGVDFDIVGELDPQEDEILVTGSGQQVLYSTWVPVSSGGISGWVNSRFLAEVVNENLFCDDKEATILLDNLEQSIIAQDGERLASLVHPERGLRMRQSWWNPEITLYGEDIENLFTSAEKIDWGIQDGSGEPLVGSFSEIMLPLMQKDMEILPEIGCNEILHGGTAGLIQLPDGYEGISLLSLYNPGTDTYDGMDWGTWVVGVELWQGRYYVSFLVHYGWEI